MPLLIWPEKFWGTVNAEAELAIDGYDPVSYFLQGRATLGSSDHQFHWREVDWYFSSADNKGLFALAPEKFAPQYGGYCAYAADRGYSADADPAVWVIEEGRLYLFYNTGTRNDWLIQRDI